MLWRKTIVAAIAGLSYCRRRKWWIRSTRCHCFNGEEKNSRCWVWTKRLPRLKAKLLFMLWKPTVIGGAHACSRTVHGEGVAAAVTGEKRGYCSTDRTVGELVSRGGREKGDFDGAKTQPGEGFWFLLCLWNENKWWRWRFWSQAIEEKKSHEGLALSSWWLGKKRRKEAEGGGSGC